MNAKEYIKKKIKEYDSSIDISPGSPIGDLFINPLSTILQPLLNFEDQLLNNLSLQDPENMSDDDIEAIAANYLIERLEGQKATGNIRLFYNSPVSINIPKGTTFSNNAGKTYQTTKNYAVTKQGMTLNNEYFPLYHSGDIPIEATEYGITSITKANTITNLISFLDPTPASVRNLVALSNAEERESNTALKNKILASVNNKSVASSDGIKRTLQETFPSINSITVVGNGDTELVRDITYSGVSFGNYYTSDFNYKVSGLYNYPYNESIAYTGRFIDIDESEKITLPDPEDFTYEFTNKMYEGIFKADDPMYAELGVYNILEENFNEPDTATGYKLTWIASDGLLGLNKLARAEEIKTDGNTIKLGVYEDSEDVSTYRRQFVSIDYPSVRAMLDALKEIIDEDAAAKENDEDVVPPSRRLPSSGGTD